MLVNSCKKKEVFPNVDLFGHAGMGLNIPNAIFAPNSLESIELASNFEKISGVEIDVRLSKDGHLWCFHDETLNQSTNGSGCVENLLSQELENLNYSTVHKEKLFQLNSHSLRNDKIYFFDLKLYNNCNQKFVDILEFRNQLMMISTEVNFKVIVSNKSYLPFFENDFDCYFSGSILEIDNNMINNSILKGFVVRNAEVSKQWIENIQTHNKEVILYDIRSNKGNKSAFQKSPNAIFSDDLRSAIGYLP